MKVENIHQRVLLRPIHQVGELLDTLSSPRDRLWPAELWPPMKLDRALGIGAKGGHGPVRYFVAAFERGKSLCFTFTGPAGFDGFHRFELIEKSPGETVLRHVLRMKAKGRALVTWPAIFRPLHDALLEDLLDKAENQLGLTVAKTRWSLSVRFLRFVLKKR